MSGDPWDITGGSAGHGARQVVDVASLRHAATVLERHAALGELVAARLSTTGTASCLLRTGPLDPRGLADVEAALAGAVAGRASAGAVAAQALVLVVRVRAAAALAEHGEMVVRMLVEQVRAAAAEAAGKLVSRAVLSPAGPFVVAGTSSAVCLYYSLHLYPVLFRWARDGVPQARDGHLDAGEVVELLAQGYVEAVDDGTDRALVALATHPELAEQLVAASPSFVDGLTRLPPVERALGHGETSVTGGASDIPDVAERLALLASLSPTFRDRPVRATPTLDPPPPPARPPRGPADLVGRLAALDAGTGRMPARIRVERVDRPGAGPAWVVLLPGVQSWNPVPGANAFSPTAVLPAAAGDPSSTTRAVVDAVVAAGAKPGQPVLLAGHSYGGMAATQIAADPAVRKWITPTAVLTVGSPVGSIDVPEDVEVLSVEHGEDLVTLIDGEPNPDKPNRTTARRELLDPATGDAATKAVFAGDPFAAHDVDAYWRSTQLLEQVGDESVQSWTAAASDFFDATGQPGAVTATDWTLLRDPGPFDVGRRAVGVDQAG